MLCSHCSSPDLRRSSFHKEDLVRLLVFQLPVRCRECHERMFTNLLVALNLPRSRGPSRVRVIRNKNLFASRPAWPCKFAACLPRQICYSWRNASIGCTREARQAGAQPAARAVASKSAAAQMSVPGSLGLRP